MHDKSLRVVLLSCDGLCQRFLLAQLAANFNLVGWVVHATPNAKGSLPGRLMRYLNPLTLARHLRARILLPKFDAAAQPMVEELFFPDGSPPVVPAQVSRADVDSINSPEAVKFVNDKEPDIVCVNGTNLLREPMLALIPKLKHGIINLHTGLSPYSRGGNCNLFMLLEGKPELVGVTVHHIDKGIDSGDIIFTGRPDIALSDTYEMIEAKGFRLGIELMVKAVGALAAGRALRVKQWEAGKLFLRRTGYVYQPHFRVRVQKMISQGLLKEYLANRETRDRGVRLIGADQT